MTKRETERLAALEARFDSEITSLKEDVGEIKTDVKTLLAWHHKQKGYITAAVLFLTAIGSAVVAFLKQIWAWLVS